MRFLAGGGRQAWSVLGRTLAPVGSRRPRGERRSGPWVTPGAPPTGPGGHGHLRSAGRAADPCAAPGHSSPACVRPQEELAGLPGRPGRSGPQPGAAADLLCQRAGGQVGTQILRGGDDQRVEQIRRLRGAFTSALRAVRSCRSASAGAGAAVTRDADQVDRYNSDTELTRLVQVTYSRRHADSRLRRPSRRRRLPCGGAFGASPMSTWHGRRGPFDARDHRPGQSETSGLLRQSAGDGEVVADVVDADGPPRGVHHGVVLRGFVRFVVG